jgi:hypothetical protein
LVRRVSEKPRFFPTTSKAHRADNTAKLYVTVHIRRPF